MGSIGGELNIPFKFYDSLEKRSIYKGCGRYDVEDIAHNERLISWGCRLLPFQIKRDGIPNGIDEFTVTIVNVNTEVETVITSYIPVADWSIWTVGTFDYITYLGELDIEDGGNCVLENCVYYVVFFDGVNTWYSEDLKIVGIGETTPEMEENYRKWSDGRGNLRTVDDTDLRIYKD